MQPTRGSISPALTQVVNPRRQSINVALAANGGVASASSTYSAGFPVSAVNNGDRTGAGWGSGGGWNDATPSAYPDWVQIDFSGSKTIDHVIVYHAAGQLRESGRADCGDRRSRLYGVTDFTVQTWNGAAWVTQGTISGNSLVMRTVNFAPVTTDRIRVNITGALLAATRAWSKSRRGPRAVAPPPTTTTVTSSLNPSTSGTSVTFTATITGASPTGAVDFTDNGDAIAGCTAAIVSAAKATCTTSLLAVGKHSIVGTYGGDADNAGSISPALTQVVNAGARRSTSRWRPMAEWLPRRARFSAGFPVERDQQRRPHRRRLGQRRRLERRHAGATPTGCRSSSTAEDDRPCVVVHAAGQLRESDATDRGDPVHLYGVTDFTRPDAGTAAAWVTQGTVSGNNLVMRTVNFAPVTTDRIRVNVTGALLAVTRAWSKSRRGGTEAAKSGQRGTQLDGAQRHPRVGLLHEPAGAQFFGEPHQRFLVAARDAQHVVERAGHQRRLEDPRDFRELGLEHERRRVGTQLDVDDRGERHAHRAQVDLDFVLLDHARFLEAPHPLGHGVGAQVDALAQHLVAGPGVLPERFDDFSVEFVHGCDFL